MDLLSKLLKSDFVPFGNCAELGVWYSPRGEPLSRPVRPESSISDHTQTPNRVISAHPHPNVEPVLAMCLVQDSGLGSTPKGVPQDDQGRPQAQWALFLWQSLLVASENRT